MESLADSVLNECQTPVAVIDASFRVRECNPAFVEFVGHEHVGNIAGAQVSELIDRASFSAFIALVNRALTERYSGYISRTLCDAEGTSLGFCTVRVKDMERDMLPGNGREYPHLEVLAVVSIELAPQRSIHSAQMANPAMSGSYLTAL